ncbi:MAG: repressor LexA [bacterium]|nr:repressor LexA [bacterium]
MASTLVGQTRLKVFEFVRSRVLDGEPPTVREVQEALGFRAIRTAHYHLERLVAEGRLTLEKGKARGYRLPERSGDGSVVLVPLLGRVQAGALTTAYEELEGHIPVRTRRSRDQLFALRVRGESMTGAGILPDDVVIVRRQPAAESGEIVVALVGSEATVKTLRMRQQVVELHSENPDFEPIFPDQDVTILGKVIEVRRTLD